MGGSGCGGTGGRSRLAGFDAPSIKKSTFTGACPGDDASSMTRRGGTGHLPLAQAQALKPGGGKTNPRHPPAIAIGRGRGPFMNVKVSFTHETFS